ncbi:MAG: N-acetylglucosamine-6-phosphate deacetylase [Halanaerobiaceae bacterium]
MDNLILEGGKIVTPYEIIEDGRLVVQDNIIEAVGSKENIDKPEGTVIDIPDLILLPGFIDIHIHGCQGVSASGGKEDIKKMADYLPETGVTGWLPTINSREDMSEVVEMAEEYEKGAKVLGIHMEGPFLTPKNLPGTEKKEPELPDLNKYEKMLETGAEYFKIMGLSPELKGACNLIKEMKKTGVTPACAHTKGTYEQFMAAVECGLKHITHAYNVMTGFHHRKPGVLGGVLSCDAVTAELIGDGYHVSPVAMDILIRCKGVNNIALITDNTELAGLPDGIYGERKKEGGIIRKVGFSEDQDGTISGSAWPFDHDIRTVKKATGKNIKDIALMSSTIPSQIINMESKKGTLEVGKDADIVGLNEKLEVQLTIVNGKIQFQK